MSELIARLSRDPNLTNALATVASVIIAGVALLISWVSLYMAYATLKHQRRHNVLSVRPIPLISVGDYEERLTVKIENNGSGPLVVKDLSVSNGKQLRKSLIEWMPDLPTPVNWATFVGAVKDRSISPGGELKLLELTGDEADPEFCAARDTCRVALRSLTVVLDYTDVYETGMKPCKRSLSWFGRDKGSDRQQGDEPTIE